MKLKIALCIGAILLFVSTAITFFTLKAQVVQNNEPKVSLQQLQSENGVIPVEIQRPQANFKTENSVENIAFVVKNNTNKSITAFCLVYSIKIERNKIETQDNFYHTIETFVHKDVRENGSLKSISPGGEEVVAEQGETSYENGSIIKGIEARIDYVEFEDGTTLGANVKGAKLISLIRDGANKYKDWLARKYVEKGKSIDAIVSLLQADDIPTELEFNSPQQNLGARIYRRNIRRVYKNQDNSELKRFLDKTLVTPKVLKGDNGYVN